MSSYYRIVLSFILQASIRNIHTNWLTTNFTLNGQFTIFATALKGKKTILEIRTLNILSSKIFQRK